LDREEGLHRKREIKKGGRLYLSHFSLKVAFSYFEGKSVAEIILQIGKERRKRLYGTNPYSRGENTSYHLLRKGSQNEEGGGDEGFTKFFYEQGDQL